MGAIKGSKRLMIDVSKCPQDHKCPALDVCPTHALSQKDMSAPEIDYGKCITCGRCAKFCPKDALYVEVVQ